MMKIVDRARLSIMIVGSFLSTFEIVRINKKVIKAKKKDVCVRIVIQPRNASDSNAFLPVKNHVRLYVPLFEGLSPPFEGFPPFDHRLDYSPQFGRQVIVDRLEMLVAIVRTKERIVYLGSAIVIQMSNPSFAR